MDNNIYYSTLDSGKNLEISQMSLYKEDIFLVYLYNDKVLK